MNKYIDLEWDNLIILDAARFDIFNKLYPEAEEFDSEATGTEPWYNKHWTDGKWDMVLISANPHAFASSTHNVYKNFKDSYWADHEGKEFKKSKMKKIVDHGGLQAFHPRIAFELFKEIKKPDTRYIIHLIPPHLPFITRSGKNLLKKIGAPVGMHRKAYGKATKYGQKGNWNELRKEYKKSLKDACDYVLANLDIFDGDTVITADHGELIGEPDFGKKGIYLHGNPALRSVNNRKKAEKVLRSVPWMKVK